MRIVQIQCCIILLLLSSSLSSIEIGTFVYYRGFEEYRKTSFDQNNKIDNKEAVGVSSRHLFGLFYSQDYGIPLFIYGLYDFEYGKYGVGGNELRFTRNSFSVELFGLPVFIPGLSFTYDHDRISQSSNNYVKSIDGFKISVIENIVIPFVVPSINNCGDYDSSNEQKYFIGPIIRYQPFIGRYNGITSFGNDLKFGMVWSYMLILQAEVGIHYNNERISDIHIKSIGTYLSININFPIHGM